MQPRPRPHNRTYTAPLAPRIDASAHDAWAESMRREIPASELPASTKNAVWRHIKAHHPERVAFLNDPLVQDLIKNQGATPTFPPELIKAALAAQPKDTK